MHLTNLLPIGLVAIVAADTFVPSLNIFRPVAFTPTFFDTFSGAPGTLPTDENWLFDLGSSYPGAYFPFWGNDERQVYTNSNSNIHITAEHNLAIIPLFDNGAWTSARIETRRSFSCAPGKRLLVEARIKLGDAPQAQQQGIWPAFWALGSAFRGNYANWPWATEWDIMEVINGASHMYGTVHCGTVPAGPCNEKFGLHSGAVPFSMGQWHTLSFVVDRDVGVNATWMKESLNWYLDGVKIFTVTGKKVGDAATWELLAHQEHFLLLNVAVGGSLPGQPNGNTTDGVRVGMEVDYVGVWNSM